MTLCVLERLALCVMAYTQPGVAHITVCQQKSAALEPPADCLATVIYDYIAATIYLRILLQKPPLLSDNHNLRLPADVPPGKTQMSVCLELQEWCHSLATGLAYNCCMLLCVPVTARPCIALVGARLAFYIE